MPKKTVKIKRKQVRELCKCILTTNELLAYGQKMADSTQEIRSLEDQLTSVKKDFQARIDQQDAEVGRLSSALRSGYEHRDTDCELIMNWTDKTVKLVRLDTGEVIRSRVMSDDEKQMPLDVVDEEVIEA